MTSFISNFRPLLVAALVIGLIEVISRAMPIPQKYNTELLTLAPQQKERITGIFITEKLHALGAIPGRFLQIGDSSGFYGIVPEELTDLPGTWLNFGCCARTGFGGYRILATEILRRQRAIGNKPEYLVLAMTPYYAPLAEFEESELARSMATTFDWWLRPRFWLGGLRLAFTNALYRGEPVNQFLDSRTDLYWGLVIGDIRDDLAGLGKTRGWMERPGQLSSIKTDLCRFPLEQDRAKPEKTLLRGELDRTAEYAAERDLKLVVVINPVACDPEGGDGPAFQAELDAFRLAHPSVAVPFKVIRRYPVDQFKDDWHLSANGARRNSREIAQAMQQF